MPPTSMAESSAVEAAPTKALTPKKKPAAIAAMLLRRIMMMNVAYQAFWICVEICVEIDGFGPVSLPYLPREDESSKTTFLTLDSKETDGEQKLVLLPT